MKELFISLVMIPMLVMTSCEDDCVTLKNWQEEDVVELITLAPIQSSFQQGDVVTLTIDLPASNDFFADYIDNRQTQVNLFEETGDHVALITLGDDELFLDNTLTFIKGSRGEFPNWFILPYNSQTEMYELEVQISLDRTGAYSHEKSGQIYLGPPDPTECSNFLLNVQFADIEGQFVEFTVNESSAAE
ncbi:hypothetical protein [Rhodohalobacter mucosus]|uniref:Uncharacterized protein n=1 Tax=Rhodohalobacter mucosus TaxID=2079485 RepID=A0A316TRS7_9BACT|nr:hypothetical protein [Rhodohalobacter mucosus]PWN07323.1 hypothetical protein DDZ15_03380 [Rhodohalobacter mucosus]